MRTLVVGVALVLFAAPSFAQTAADPHWAPWLGCWDLVLENARDGVPAADTPRELPRSRDSITPRVCVETAPGGGATFRTTIGTETPIVQTLIADGTDRPIDDGECHGTQRADWSHDGLRLFLRAELTCKNDQAPRRISGFAMLGPNATWTDVQAIEIAGRDSYRVRRYRRADAATVSSATIKGRALTLDDVKEAAGKVSPHALEAALVESRASFPLSSRRLVELADAKVPEHVIDLMVALSYPKRFVVERTARADRAPAPIVNDPFMLGWAFGYPMWSDSFGFYSPLYGAYSSYFYSPFAYGYLGGYNPYFGGGGYVVIDDGGGGSSPNRPSGNGRVVDGLGYTRVHPREPQPTTASRDNGGSPSSVESSSSSSSSGSSVTSQGFTSGGSSGGSGGGSSGGDGGGRTAQPR